MHRIFFAPIRADVELAWAHEHWTTKHNDVFAQTPGLRGYVQNRPPQDAWSGRTHVCAESWFDDRNAERAGYASEYYRTAVTEDEERFVQRDQAWVSAVTMLRSARVQRTYRVLAFGQTEASATDWLASWDPDDIDVFELARQPWTCGKSAALGLWTDDLTRATDAVVHFGPLSILSEPVAVIVAPESPWTAS
jgi:hypothetical protein